MNRVPMTVYVREIGDCHLPHDGRHHPHHVYNFPLAPTAADRNACLKCGEHITIKEH